jgi:hypothetical protein
MSANPFLRRVLGESEEPMPSEEGSPDVHNQEPPEMEDQPDPGDLSQAAAASIPTQELARMWQEGQKMDVATQLMFTPASYVDFVDLCFLLGQGEGQQLGRMLDELADSENIPVPEPSSDYSSILQRVSANRGKNTME